MKEDIRLYRYEDGNLRKVGRLKTPSLQRHYFETVEQCLLHIVDNLISEKNRFHMHYQKDTFVIVKYTGTWQSEVVCIFKQNKRIDI